MGSEIEKKSAQTTLAQYGGFDLEEMQQTAENLPTGGGNYFKPRQGKNVVRFIPPPLGKKATMVWYKHWFQIGNERQSIICTKYQYNQPCPVCKKGSELKATGNKIDSRKARALEPQSSVYANVVDMMDPEKGVQVWTMSPGLFKDITSAVEMADVGKVFADPQKGFNIIFKRKGEGKDTEYSGHMVARESSPLPGWEDLLPTQVDLAGVESAPSDEQQDEAVDAEYEARGDGGGKRGAKGKKGETKSRGDGLDLDDEEDADISI
jgi:hypothetical protein